MDKRQVSKKNNLCIFVGFFMLFILLLMVTYLSTPLAAEKPKVFLYNITDLTGAYGPTGIWNEKGGLDYLAWIAEKGGIDIDGDGKGDVEVVYKWAEFGNVDARFVSAYKRFRGSSNKPTIIQMDSSPNQEMLKPILERDQINCYGTGCSDPQLYPPAWNFMDGPSYGEDAAGAIEYYIDNLWPKRGKGIKAKVAHLTWDSSFGRAPIEPTIRHGQLTGKYEVVGQGFCSALPTDVEIIAYLSDFEKKGADIIFSNTMLQTPAVIGKTIRKLGLAGKMALIGDSWAPADQVLDITGPEAGEGYISIEFVRVPAAEPDEPGVKFGKMLNDKYRKEKGLPNIIYLRGIRLKVVELEAMRRGLVGIMKRDGVNLAEACKKITGKDVKEFGLQTMAGYTAMGITSQYNGAPAGKDDRRGANTSRLVGIKNGKVTILSPWYVLPRLIPEEMIQKGFFKDELPLNIHYVVKGR